MKIITAEQAADEDHAGSTAGTQEHDDDGNDVATALNQESTTLALTGSTEGEQF